MKFSSASTAGAALALALAASAAEVAPQRTTLESHFCEFWTVKDETFFVFKSSATKRVTLTGTNLKIVCDQLEITATGIDKTDKDKDGKAPALPSPEKFKYLLATGNVHIVQGEREARAGRAEVFPGQDLIELTQNPVVIDHGSDTVKDGVVDHSNDYEQTGERIEMLRAERRVRVYGSKLEGPAIRDLGFDKSQPAPKADADAKGPNSLPGLTTPPPKK